MRIVVLSQGAVVAQEGSHSWLFSAPEGIFKALKENGLEKPSVLFTTSLRSPGYTELGEILRFKEDPLSMNGMKATPVTRKHGTDYIVTGENSKILFSERGDVSTEDTTGFDLVVIKNKHRSDGLGDNVITWPWVDSEYNIENHIVTPIFQEVQLKVWSSLEDVPANLKKVNGTPLSLEQANFIARIAKASADGKDENFAIGMAAFKKTYVAKDGKWVKKNTTEKQEKKTKAEVNYKKSDSKKVCGVCRFFLRAEEDEAPAKCQLVEGGIKYDDTCDLFQAAEKVTGKEELKNGDGRIASDHLVVVDPKKVGTWHLPYKTNGKLDSKLMGGAAAALTVGYRGNKYEGPDKDAAVKKLAGAYTTEEKDMPENLEEAYEKLKEMVSSDTGGYDKPVKRFGDVITAALHTAYNDTADHYFKEGYLSQEERMEVAGAVGPALTALRNGLSKELMRRDISYAVTVPSAYKEIVPNAPDLVDGDWTSVYKSDKDEWRWASISSIATWDKQNELFTEKAMDWAIAFSKLIDDKGPLRFKHVPGLDGGTCDTQLRVGAFLFESGLILDTPVGLAMRTQLKNNPKDWQISVGLAYGKDDLDTNGVYKRAAIFERSMTRKPAHPDTVIISKEKEYKMTILSDAQLQEAAEELGMDLADVKALYDRAVNKEGASLGLKEFTSIVLKEDGLGAATATHESKKKRDMAMSDEEYEEKYGKKRGKKYNMKGTTSLKTVLSDLSGTEINELYDLLEEVEKEKKPRMMMGEDGEEYTEEEYEEKYGKKKGNSGKYKDKEVDARISRIEDMVHEQTKTLTQFVQAITSGKQAKTQNDFSSAVADFMTTVPRQQAGEFLSGTNAAGRSVSEELTALKNLEAEPDEAVMAKLKEIQESINQEQGGMGSIYDLFTSKNLNPS